MTSDFSPAMAQLVDNLDRLLGGPHPFDWEAVLAEAAQRSADNQEALKAYSEERRRRHLNEDRANRSGRTRYTLDPIPGFHPTPNKLLSQAVKVRRTASLKAASERRQKRREHGVVIIHDRKTWKDMTKSEQHEFRRQRDAFLLEGGMGDITVEDIEEERGVDHVGFLYRFGRPPKVDMATCETIIAAWGKPV